MSSNRTSQDSPGRCIVYFQKAINQLQEYCRETAKESTVRLLKWNLFKIWAESYRSQLYLSCPRQLDYHSNTYFQLSKPAVLTYSRAFDFYIVRRDWAGPLYFTISPRSSNRLWNWVEINSAFPTFCVHATVFLDMIALACKPHFPLPAVWDDNTLFETLKLIELCTNKVF